MREYFVDKYLSINFVLYNRYVGLLWSSQHALNQTLQNSKHNKAGFMKKPT